MIQNISTFECLKNKENLYKGKMKIRVWFLFCLFIFLIRSTLLFFLHVRLIDLKNKKAEKLTFSVISFFFLSFRKCLIDRTNFLFVSFIFDSKRIWHHSKHFVFFFPVFFSHFRGTEIFFFIMDQFLSWQQHLFNLSMVDKISIYFALGLLALFKIIWII